MSTNEIELKSNTSNSEMTTEEAISFAYGNNIPMYKSMAKELGEEILLKMLGKAAADKIAQEIEFVAKDMPVRDMAHFSQFLKSYLASPPFNTILKNQITEESEKVIEVTHSECLFAKIFRDMDASEIGYVLECSATDVAAKAFNPKMKATTPKCLMKGDNCCIERFELDE